MFHTTTTGVHVKICGYGNKYDDFYTVQKNIVLLTQFVMQSYCLYLFFPLHGAVVHIIIPAIFIITVYNCFHAIVFYICFSLLIF
jgi:hypothetical protein